MIEADEAGHRMLDSGSIDRELKCWQEVRREARMAGLSEHEKALARLAEKHTPVSTVRLRELYVAGCHERGIPPLARRTFSKCLSRLIAADLLRVTARPGAGGRRLAYVADK
ncbi:MAG: hypothetical protein KA383_05220 [Phycisphaerae bacterium]|nr:hypothetical protein [Phycisphaerae bacterium]